jgi:phosphoglycolate phosphatase-like HAD superfamily hydrolase
LPKLVLYDIDGTLVLTGGAGLRAMDRAFEHLLDVRGALDGVPAAGRTDLAILRDAARRATPDFVPDAAWVERFRDYYVGILAEELNGNGSGKSVLPGVRESLDAFARVPGVHVALLTGNFRLGAEVKLSHFDLWSPFPFGAFGDDTEDRNHLFPVAMDLARAHGIIGLAPADVVVIGDTPHDIECARSGGGVSVGVATGPFDRAALQRAGADIAIDDLRDIDALMTSLRNGV